MQLTVKTYATSNGKFKVEIYEGDKFMGEYIEESKKIIEDLKEWNEGETEYQYFDSVEELEEYIQLESGMIEEEENHECMQCGNHIEDSAEYCSSKCFQASLR